MSPNTLESRGYVATDGDIHNLAAGLLEALSSADGSRRSYLRALIGTTQNELGAPARQRAVSHASKIKDEDVRAQHLAALEAVHERFYSIVMKVTADKLQVPEGRKKGDELNRRTNFARTAMYAIRSWMRAGNDITSLVAAKVTKGALAVDGKRKRRLSTSRLSTRAERQSKQLLVTMKTLASTDREAAITEIRELVSRLASQLSELGVTATKDARQAVAEMRPFRVGGSTFMPTVRAA